MSGGRTADRGGADKVAVVSRRGTAKPAPAADESKGENPASRTKPERDLDRPEEPADRAPENPVRKLPEKPPKQAPTQTQPEKGDIGSGEARTRPAEKQVDSFGRLGQALGDLNNRPAKKGEPAKEGKQGAGAKRDNPGPAKDQEGDGSRAEGTGTDVITDPVKARLRARELMRKVRIEFDGRITGTRGDEASAREVLGEVICTCPETASASLTATSWGRPPARSTPAWGRSKATAGRRRRWPSCPAAPPSTPASTAPGRPPGRPTSAAMASPALDGWVSTTASAARP
jgi:hypothetical protein